MKRDLATLARTRFDVVVVGGGIFGICTAWEAISRGLSVALIERADFGSGTSAHSFKMVHGGIRYLQHGDLIRMRESCRERRAFLRIAPHLVHPLPTLIPTYGHGMAGKEILRAGCALYDALTLDRNRGVADPERRIPASRGLSRRECLAEFPELDAQGLSGAVEFHDAQMYNPPRLVLAFAQSAAASGAVVANYVEAVGLLQRADRIVGVRARDLPSGDEFEIRARMVVNATGAWAPRFVRAALGRDVSPPLTFSRDACLVVRRRLLRDRALAVLGRTSDPDALLARPARHLFLAPWRGVTLVGVWHQVHEGGPESFSVTEREIEGWLEEVNGAWPSASLRREDVALWNAGLVLFGENEPGATHLSYGKRSRIVDHAREDGIEGLISLIGVRFTTGRLEAKRVVDRVGRRLEQRLPPSLTDRTPVAGGDVDCFSAFRDTALANAAPRVSSEALGALLRNHGSGFEEVLRVGGEEPGWLETLDGSTTLQAEVVHAARNEMVETLQDVVLRRTDLGTAGHPGGRAIELCSVLLAQELGWDEPRRKREIEQLEAHYAR